MLPLPYPLVVAQVLESESKTLASLIRTFSIQNEQCPNGGTSFGGYTVWIDDILLPIDSDGDGVIDREDATPYVPNVIEP